MKGKHHIANYIKTIDNATEENLHDILMAENQGKLTFVGMNFLPDLYISTPLGLARLLPGTLFYIRAEAWMLVEPSDGSSDSFWICRNGEIVSHDELYIHSLRNSNTLFYMN